MAEKSLLIAAPNFSTGYFAQLEGRQPTDMSQPSANTRLTRLGEAYTRPGYMNVGLDLGLTTPNNLIGYRMQRLPLTFFSGGGKLLYCKDSGVPTAPFSAAVDTGLTLTASTMTLMSEYSSGIFATNTTDGLLRIAVLSLGTAAASSDTFLNLSTADGFRIPSTGILRIAGTNMQYSSKPAQVALASLTSVTTTATGTTSGSHGLITGMQISISGAADNKYNGTFIATSTGATTFTYTIVTGATSPDTGTPILTSDAVACTTTVGANYSAGEIALFVDTTTATSSPKGSKVEFWIESANVVGVQANFSTNYQAPTYTHFYADSADAHAVGGLAKAYTFSGGKSGNNIVGRRGVLTNILALNDYLFLFTELETYKISNADVNIVTGERTPRLFTPAYGCANQFCAGNGGECGVARKE